MQNAIIDSKDLAEALSYWATTGGILIALLAGIAAYWKYRGDQRQHEWDRARESYATFMDRCLDHPEFHPRFWTEIAANDPVASNKYRWFIARFLWACEEILTNAKRDDVWRGALRITIVEHIDYFTSTIGRSDSQWYYPAVQELIAEAEREAKGLGLIT